MSYRILYIHGLGSGADSRTSHLIRKAFSSFQSLYSVEVFAPEIPLDPLVAAHFLRDNYSSENIDLVVGTSLGGFYSFLIRGVKRLVVNPALFADEDIRDRIGMGRKPFFSKRSDKAKDYLVDDVFIGHLRTLREEIYSGLDEEEKANTFGLFGEIDELLDHREDFRSIFGSERLHAFPGGHRIGVEDAEKHLDPLIKEILEDIPERKNTYVQTQEGWGGMYGTEIQALRDYWDYMEYLDDEKEN